MEARKVLGELGDSLFSFLGIESQECANVALKKCDEYLNAMRNTDFSNYPLATLEMEEQHIQLVTLSKKLLEKALLEEDKKRNTLLIHIRAMLNNQG